MTRLVGLVVAVLASCFVVGHVEARGPKSFYVAPDGHDAALGTSPARAWQSLARVNAEPLVPGDRVSFRAGASFPGTLRITYSGTSGRPIRFSSYARVQGSRATILAGAGPGIHLVNAEHIRIAGLTVIGAGPSFDGNTSSGLWIQNTYPAERVFSSITVDDVDVSGFHYGGVEVIASRFVDEAAGVTRRRGFRDLRFTRIAAHHNGWGGMWVGGCGNYPDFPDVYCHQNVYIGHSRFHDNDGVILPYHTGDGVYVWDVDGGTIEYCLAYRNGRLNQTVMGPVGIWAFWSTRLLIQFNESYENKTQGGDGGGFDIDGGTSHSIVQYNYSHDNHGYGYYVAQVPDASFRLSRANVVRYNISENDARAGAIPGAIHIGGDGPLRDIEIYNNTVFISAAGLLPQWAPPSAIRVWGDLANIQVRNNLFVALDGIPLVRVEHPGATFTGNAYWTGGGPVLIEGAWEDPGGLFADPLLTAPGAGGTVGDPRRLRTLDAYRLQAGSPLINRGVPTPGPRDFYGARTPRGGAYDIGAAEF